MTFRTLVVATVLGVLGATSGAAQDFGVMESAETIHRGNFKLVAYPMFVLGEGGADNVLGAVLRGGIG